jgi:hypothetical protein
MTPQMSQLVFCGFFILLGVLSLLAGALNWDWWLKSVGLLVTWQHGRDMARIHFVIFGLMAIGLGVYFTYDALTSPRFWPLPKPPG